MPLHTSIALDAIMIIIIDIPEESIFGCDHNNSHGRRIIPAYYDLGAESEKEVKPFHSL